MTYNEQIILDLNKVVNDITNEIEEEQDRSSIFAFYIQIVDAVKNTTEDELLEKLLKMILAEGVISYAIEQEDNRFEKGA